MRYDEGMLGKPEGLPAGRADRVEYSELGQKSSPKQRALDLARFDERVRSYLKSDGKMYSKGQIPATLTEWRTCTSQKLRKATRGDTADARPSRIVEFR